MINDHRCFRYHSEEGARIFEVGEKIPDGWVDTPDKLKKANQQEVLEPEKYPSQMNKHELAEFGEKLGLELDMDMSKRDMRDAINIAMAEGSEE